jgi:hypothetical protein
MVILLSTYQFLEVKSWPERDTLSEKTSVTSLIASAPRTSSREPPSANSEHGKGRIERFVESGLGKYPSAWCILTPEQSTSRQAEVLMSSGESLMGIDQLEVQDQVSVCTAGPNPSSDYVPCSASRAVPSQTSSHRLLGGSSQCSLSANLRNFTLFHQTMQKLCPSMICPTDRKRNLPRGSCGVAATPSSWLGTPRY